jgi:hypothetical protein
MLASLSREHGLVILRDFLTAHAAKDCAVMVALQRVPLEWEADEGEHLLHDAASGTRLRYRVSFLDLALKQARRMPAYLALDRAVVAACVPP